METVKQMIGLGWKAMAAVFERQQSDPSVSGLNHNELVAQMVEAEVQAAQERKYARLDKQAKMKIRSACIENIDYRTARGLDKNVMAALNTGAWVDQHRNLLITGIAGNGKTYLACAQGTECIRRGIPVLYKRVSHLFEEMELARAEGSLPKYRARVKKVGMLILDDLGLSPLTHQNREDLLEIIEDRTGTGSIAVTSQLPVDKWHSYIGEPTLADAIMDRLYHGAHILTLHGESMRKLTSIEENTYA